jgi:hypothetical protein
MHGHGIFNFEDGNVYEGDFNRGLIEGFGILKSLDGCIYEGEFKAG